MIKSSPRPIVVGSDGSPTATVAVQRAAQLACDRHTRLHIVTAYTDATARQRREIEMMPDEFVWLASPGQMAEQTAAGAARIAKDAAPVSVEARAEYGDPAKVLIDVAQAVGADTIVVGNRGMQGVGRFVRGSVPNRLSHSAPCDVLIVDTSGRAA
jgi:nucleotide-binding universal stress UspA family protein